MEDITGHARRRYCVGQFGPRPLARTRLGHGLYRAHDPGRRTPPCSPLPRMARGMAEEARTIRLQDLAGFCLGQDRVILVSALCVAAVAYVVYLLIFSVWLF